MRRFYYMLLFLFLIELPAFAQTVFWSEGFVSGQGWTVDGNWKIENDMMGFFWSPQLENFDCSSISPIIHLHESSTNLIVGQFLDVFATTSDEMAEISVITQSGEDILWSYALSNGNWGSTSGDDLEIPIADYAGQDVQIKFRTYGASTFNWSGWYIFNVRLNADLDNDLAVTDIIGPKKLDIGETGTWDVKIKNFGFQPASNFSIKLFNYKTGELIASIDDTEEIDPLANKFYTFNWSSPAAYNTALYSVIVFEDDEFIGNNTSKSHFIRINPEIDFSVLVWDNDNDIPTVSDPEQGDEIQPSESLTRALELAGIQYTYSKSLPGNLTDFDMVFGTMGCYCLS
ncbi:MAG: hypothetical protein GXO89_16470 [Chlorobi bacterium]|nr:hypothetical protein [Chlorobiota bacterium]